jgi:protein-S-isoprenylcysteine O-methyltransferase Ste14
LYLAEMVATCGVMLGYRQPWAGLIVLASIGLQLRRMHFEEEVMRSTYPEYEAYARTTARLIPGVY